MQDRKIKFFPNVAGFFAWSTEKKISYIGFVITIFTVAISVLNYVHSSYFQHSFVLDEAKSQALERLELGFDSNSCGNGCTHDFYGIYEFSYKTRQSKLLVFSSIDSLSSGCRACAPLLSFFLFESRNGPWQLNADYIGSFRWGQWGEIQPDSIDIYPISHHNFGIFMKIITGAQGVYSRHLQVRVLFPDEVRTVLTTCIGFDNTGYAITEDQEEVWDYDYRIVESDSGLFPIELIDGPSSPVLLEFDGSEYRASNTRSVSC